MFLVNSCSHHFIATLNSLESKSHHHQGRTFSRSYGTILPSSFTSVLSSALEFSSHPPVSVWGTVKRNLKLRGFSWKHGIIYLALRRELRHCISALRTRIFLSSLPTYLYRDNQRPDRLAYSVPPSQLRSVQEY